MLLKKTILQYHVAPRELDDKFSACVFTELLEELDPDYLYFTDEDLVVLRPYAVKIGDELKGATWAFLPQVQTIYKKCLARAESTVSQLLKTPFTFAAKENF